MMLEPHTHNRPEFRLSVSDRLAVLRSISQMLLLFLLVEEWNFGNTQMRPKM
jgi:hypothetical protein